MPNRRTVKLEVSSLDLLKSEVLFPLVPKSLSPKSNINTWKSFVIMVKIFVGNLPRATNEDEIKALFTEYGTVTECRSCNGRGSRGFEKHAYKVLFHK
uniref:RRM domain-containing protein n=1 Tax=Neolamprologus brichardi TaxID=32507 RepID=A0A3Q4HGF2_NEOBR